MDCSHQKSLTLDPSGPRPPSSPFRVCHFSLKDKGGVKTEGRNGVGPLRVFSTTRTEGPIRSSNTLGVPVLAGDPGLSGLYRGRTEVEGRWLSLPHLTPTCNYLFLVPHPFHPWGLPPRTNQDPLSGYKVRRSQVTMYVFFYLYTEETQLSSLPSGGGNYLVSRSSRVEVIYVGPRIWNRYFDPKSRENRRKREYGNTSRIGIPYWDTNRPDFLHSSL